LGAQQSGDTKATSALEGAMQQQIAKLLSKAQQNKCASLHHPTFPRLFSSFLGFLQTVRGQKVLRVRCLLMLSGVRLLRRGAVMSMLTQSVQEVNTTCR